MFMSPKKEVIGNWRGEVKQDSLLVTSRVSTVSGTLAAINSQFTSVLSSMRQCIQPNLSKMQVKNEKMTINMKISSTSTKNFENADEIPGVESASTGIYTSNKTIENASQNGNESGSELRCYPARDRNKTYQYESNVPRKGIYDEDMTKIRMEME